MSWLVAFMGGFTLLVAGVMIKSGWSTIDRLRARIAYLEKSTWGDQVEFSGKIDRAIHAEGHLSRYRIGEGYGTEYFNLSDKHKRLKVGDEVIFTVGVRVPKTGGES